MRVLWVVLALIAVTAVARDSAPAAAIAGPMLDSITISPAEAAPGAIVQLEIRFSGQRVDSLQTITIQNWATYREWATLSAPALTTSGNQRIFTAGLVVPAKAEPGHLLVTEIDVTSANVAYRFSPAVLWPEAPLCPEFMDPPANGLPYICRSSALSAHSGVLVDDGSGLVETFPDLEEFELSPATVSPGGVVTARFRGTGFATVESVSLGASSTSGAQLKPITSEPTGATGVAELRVPVNTRPGSYRVSAVRVRTAIGREHALVTQTGSWLECPAVTLTDHRCWEAALAEKQPTVAIATDALVPEIVSFTISRERIRYGESVEFEAVFRNVSEVRFDRFLYGSFFVSPDITTWTFDGTTLRGTATPIYPGYHHAYAFSVKDRDGVPYTFFPRRRGNSTLPLCPEVKDLTSGALGCGWDPATVGSGEFWVDAILEITSGPVRATADPTPTFEFTLAPAVATVYCRLDGGGWTQCASPFTVPDLAAGFHVFEVEVRYNSPTITPNYVSHAARAFRVGEAGPMTILPMLSAEPQP